MKQMPTTTTATMRSRARQLYRDFGPQVNAETAARLRKARRTAMETGHSKHHRAMRWMVPASAFAVAAVAVLTIWQPLHRPMSVAAITSTPHEPRSANVLPPDTGQNDPALYQNLGFIAWLAHQPNAPSRDRH